MAKKNLQSAFSKSVEKLFEFAESGLSGIEKAIGKISGQKAKPVTPGSSPKHKKGTKTTTAQKRAQRKAQRERSKQRKIEKKARAERRVQQQEYSKKRTQARAEKIYSKNPNKVKLGKGEGRHGYNKMSAEQYKEQRLKNIKSKKEGRANEIVGNLNKLSDEMDKIYNRLPPSVQQKIPRPRMSGKHYEVDDFYGYSYESEILSDSLAELEDMAAEAEVFMSNLESLKSSFESLKRSFGDTGMNRDINDIDDAIYEIDSMIAEIRQSEVIKNLYASDEFIMTHIEKATSKQKDAMETLGLNISKL